jgi:hypothetical protein
MSAGAYAANDAFGGRLDFTGALRESGNGGVLQSVIITAPNTQTPAIDLVLFDDIFQPTTDNVAFAPTDLDMSGKCLGAVNLLAAYWTTFANNGVCTLDGIGKPIEVDNGPGTIYGQMVTRTAFTPGAVVYVVKLGFLKD